MPSKAPHPGVEGKGEEAGKKKKIIAVTSQDLLLMQAHLIFTTESN